MKTGLFASFVVAALLVARPGLALADVVPARKAKADRDAAAVEQRLVTLGVDSSTAKAGTEHLTPSELSFLAEDSSRLQNVGGLTWDEIAGGLIYGGVVALFLFLLFEHTDK
ncbi:MAG TPA: hypothetical protein VGK61_10915 [Planctomycetota bacterium]|jgi:hypothetical protein